MKLALPLALLPLAAACVVPRVDVTPGVGQFSLDGEFGAVQDGATLVRQDLDQLGLDGDETGPVARAILDWIGFRLQFDGFAGDFSGRGSTTAEIEIDDETISAGADVDSSMDLGYLTSSLTFDVIPGDTFDLGLGVGVTLLDFDASFTEIGTGIKAEANELVPLPVLAARGAFRSGRFGAFATLGLMEATVSDIEGSIIDLDVYGEFRLFGGEDHLAGRLLGGYRRVDTELQYDDGDDRVEADFVIDGPYVGLTFSF